MGKGFFGLTRNQVTLPEAHKPPSKGILDKKPPCTTCGLLKGCNTPKMPYTGKGRKRILIIAEVPGKEEDDLGKQLTGKVGITLRKYLKNASVDLDKDCWKTNAVKCKPSNNNPPTKKQIQCCRPNVLREIKKLKPEKIILLGKTAIESIICTRGIALMSLNRWVGAAIPDQQYRAWLFPTYHPSYIMRMTALEPDNVLHIIFENHLRNAIEWQKPWFSLGGIGKKVEVINNPEDACYALKDILTNAKRLTFDIESTGIKPDKEGHTIRTISFCYNINKAVAFPVFYDNTAFMNILKKVLTCKDIKKTAHNIKMEDRWVKSILGYKVKRWHWDSMVAAHVTDNRSGITGLKFQAYINYGITYSEDMKPYMEGCRQGEDPKSDNRLNLIMQAPLKPLLIYNGIDSLITHRLTAKQKPVIKARKLNYKLLHNTTMLFCDVERNGICVDIPYYKKASAALKKEIIELNLKIKNSKEIKLWKKKKGKDINLDSPSQLIELLYKILKLEPTKKTKKGNTSVDDEVLKKLIDKVSFMKHFIRIKKLTKLDNTFIASIVREAVNGVIRPSNNIHLVVTYRTSCNSPNSKNFPKRDKESQRIIRTGIIPSPGNQLLGVDYGGIEVCMSASYHHDKQMIKYITDPSTDMHRDVTMDLLILLIKQMTNELRHGGKNMFTFPQFYGDYYVSCATALWDYIDEYNTANGIPVKEHLRGKGIKTYAQFEKHVQKVEDRFWNVRFKGYTAWKKKYYAKYKKTGFLRLKTGLECSGYMKKNDVLNYPIQGVACHCLLTALHILHKKYLTNKKYNFKTKIIGEIYDEGVFDIVPKEVKTLLPIIKKVMCEDIRKIYPWIVVPLTIDGKISAIDGNWYERKKIEI